MPFRFRPVASISEALVASDNARLECLHRLGILESPPAVDIDDIVELTAGLLDCPMAFFTLIDRDVQVVKSGFGTSLTRTSRADSFCTHTIMRRMPLVIPDCLEDPRFAKNVFVRSDPFIRFYAGCPIILERHHAIGALCLADTVPRALDEEDIRLMSCLAQVLTSLVEIRYLYDSGNVVDQIMELQ